VTIVRDKKETVAFMAQPSMVFAVTTAPCKDPVDCDCGGGYVVISINPPHCQDVLLLPVVDLDRFIAMIEQNRAKLLGQVS
jgi:hypothetical protein